jgi:hypothetical protein
MPNIISIAQNNAAHTDMYKTDSPTIPDTAFPVMIKIPIEYNFIFLS